MSASKNDLDGLLSSIIQKLWSFAFRLAGDEGVAERLVQHACANWVDQEFYKVDPRSPLIGILSRIHETWLAETTPCSQQAPEQARPCDTGSPRDFAQSAGKLRFLPGDAISAIQTLPALPRVVMLLVHAEGLTCLEAADVVGLPIANIQQLMLESRMTIGSWALANHADKSKTALGGECSSESNRGPRHVGSVVDSVARRAVAGSPSSH
jgi:RNA polymerase sigma-70 factor, ECF subfamily